MTFETSHAREHPEAAAWALGALEPADAARFESHLRSCEGCQATVRQFAAVAQALKVPLSTAEPPADLGARTVAAVRYAAMAASRPAAAGHKASRWWHLH